MHEHTHMTELYRTKYTHAGAERSKQGGEGQADGWTEGAQKKKYTHTHKGV